MFHPMKVMKLLNERKEFANAHPDFYRYIKRVFGSNIPENTEIEICVKKPGESDAFIKVSVGREDVYFFKMLEDLIK